MVKSVYNEAGITEYDTYAHLMEREMYLSRLGMPTSSVCYIKDEGKFYHFDGYFLKEIVATKLN